jgi:hypothetical protein
MGLGAEGLARVLHCMSLVRSRPMNKKLDTSRGRTACCGSNQPQSLDSTSGLPPHRLPVQSTAPAALLNPPLPAPLAGPAGVGDAAVLRYRHSYCAALPPRPRPWQLKGLSEHLAEEMAEEGIEGRTITLKLKAATFEVCAQPLRAHTCPCGS